MQTIKCVGMCPSSVPFLALPLFPFFVRPFLVSIYLWGLFFVRSLLSVPVLVPVSGFGRVIRLCRAVQLDICWGALFLETSQLTLGSCW